MVCVDNSEYMRNGDYPPSRLDAQTDAVNLVCSAKLEQNAENVVGVLTAAGTHANILETATQDVGHVLRALHSVKPSGVLDLVAALHKAHLALKHRQNPHQRARVVAFVGSPLVADEDGEALERMQSKLVALGKMLKKNSVSVDVVSFGEHAQNASLLQSFIEAVDNSGSSRLVAVEAGGSQILSDVLISSAIVRDPDSAAAAVAGGGGGGGGGGDGGGTGEFPFGVDPSMDPELAMALRISMEEEQARQAAAAAASASASGSGGGEETAGGGEDVVMETEGVKAEGDADLYGGGGGGGDEMDEDEDVRLAIAMSLADQNAKDNAATGGNGDSNNEPKPDDEKKND